MFFFVNEAAYNQSFAAEHTHVGIRCAAGNAVIAQLADEYGRADFGMYLRRDHTAVAADKRCVLQLNTGVQIFRGHIGTAVVVLFRLYGNMVADKNAGFLAGNGDDARRSQHLSLALADKCVQRSVETKGVTVPEFKIAVVIIAGGIRVIVAFIIAALGDGVPVPVDAKAFIVFLTDGDDFCFQRYLPAGYIQLAQYTGQLLLFLGRTVEQQAVSYGIYAQLAFKQVFQGIGSFGGLSVAESVKP